MAAFHVRSDVDWPVVLLYFVQVAAMKSATADGTPQASVSMSCARPAVFRWSAVVTWLAGAACLVAFHGRFRIASWFLRNRHRCLAGHDHAVQCVGIDLA